MKCVLAQSDFSKALKRIVKVISQRPTHPILVCVKLTALDGKLSVEASDLETYELRMIDAVVDQEGSICIPAKQLSDLVAKLESGQALDLHTEEYNLSISTQLGDFSIAGFPVSDWPEMHFEENNISPSASQPVPFPRVNSLISGAVSKDPGVLDGVNIRWDSSGLSFAATDGHRLHAITLETDSSPEETVSETIPYIAIKQLQQENESSDISMFLGGGLVRFEHKLGFISSRTRAMPYPDWPQLIPEPAKYVMSISLERLALMRAVERNLVIAVDAANFLNLRFVPGADGVGPSLSLHSYHAQGSATEKVPCESKEADPDFSVNLNSKYLLDALDAIQGDNVLIHSLANCAVAPLTLTSVDECSSVVLMPMVVNNKKPE